MANESAHSTIEIRRARGAGRVEPILLSVLARVAVRSLPWNRTLVLFDWQPVARQRTKLVLMPPERDFRGAGACLARSLARSQYLRRRGVETELVIGATTGRGRAAEVTLDAHAWLEPLDDSPKHFVLHRIRR